MSERGHLHAFDAETGEELWRNEESAGASGPLVLGGAVVVGGGDGRLRAFDAEDGSLMALRRVGVGRVPRLIATGDGDFIATVDSGYLLGDGMLRAGVGEGGVGGAAAIVPKHHLGTTRNNHASAQEADFTRPPSFFR